MRFVSNDAEAPLYVHADHLGTPQVMTDQAANLAWDRVQRPFGGTVSITGAATNPQRFPGQLNDPETGFHYNYFRDYDPTTGRYLQSDPIGLDGGVNTYGYVLGNPLVNFDRYGLESYLYEWGVGNGGAPFPGNGNWWGNFSPQDGVCSSFAFPLDKSVCTKACCVSHDACFDNYKCNWTAWIGSIAGTRGPCQTCNATAFSCVIRNIGRTSCDNGAC